MTIEPPQGGELGGPEPLRPPDDGDPFPPRITQITPVGGALAGGITATINGSRFQPGAEVYFGSVPSPSVTYVSPVTVRAVVPAATQTGTVPITLINPDGQEATLISGYTYLTSEASLHAEVLGISPLSLLEDTETELTVRGRNLISAYTDGMVALRGPSRANVNISNLSTSHDMSTGIEELVFTVRVTATPPLTAMERIAIQVLASRRPGAAVDGVFESSRHMFVVLPRAIPVTIAFTDTLATDRPNLVVVAGRNLEGCWLDYGSGVTVHAQRSDDRNISGIVTIGDGQATAVGTQGLVLSDPASPMQLTVRNADGDAVAQFEVGVTSGGEMQLEELSVEGSAQEPEQANELNVSLTAVPNQQMLAPTEEDSAVYSLASGQAASIFFDWSNFAIDIFDLDLNFVIVNEVRLIPFFDGGGDTLQSPVLARVGELFRVRGAGLLFTLRIEIIIQIRVVLIIGYRFDIGFGLYNEFGSLYPWAIGSVVISFRVIVTLRFLLSAMAALVEPGGRLAVVFRLRLALNIHFFLSPDRTSISFDPDRDVSFKVNHGGVFPVPTSLSLCGGRFELASDNGVTSFADAKGGTQSFYFPRASGACCLPWNFNLELVRFFSGGTETVQQGFRTEFCLNAAANPDQMDVLIVSNRTPNGFPPPLTLDVQESAFLKALGRPVDEAGNPIPGAPRRDLTEMGFKVEFYLASSDNTVLDPGPLTDGSASAIIPGQNVIRVAASKLSRAIDVGTGEEIETTFLPSSVVGFSILDFLSRNLPPAVRTGNLPVIVSALAANVSVEPTLCYLEDPNRADSVREAPVVPNTSIQNPLNPAQMLAARAIERAEPFLPQRNYVLGFRLSHQGGSPLPPSVPLKFKVTTVRMRLLPLNSTTPQAQSFPLDNIPQIEGTGWEFQGNRISADVAQFFKGNLIRVTQEFTVTFNQAQAGQLVAVMPAAGGGGLLVIPNHRETAATSTTQLGLVPPGPNVADRHVLLSIDVSVESGSSDVVISNRQASIAGVVRNEENFEEYARVLAEPLSYVDTSPALSTFPVSFYNQLTGSQTAPTTAALNARGLQLWNAACTEMQTRPDDRPLYWARLQCIAAMRTYYRDKGLSLSDPVIRQFEWPSRGLTPAGVISFTDSNYADTAVANKSRRVIVTGYDPFVLPRDPDTSNPSGLVALHLNRKVVTPEKVTFVKTDTITVGNWRGVYGTEGYHLVGDAASNPPYAQPAPSGHQTRVWAPTTAEQRALQKAVGTERVAAAWFAAQFNIDINITDGKPHNVALYLLDWDGNNTRSQTVEVIDPATNAVLDTRSVSSFSAGIYLVWELTGNIRLRLTNVGATSPNAVVSGIFFDAPGSGGTGVYVRTAVFPVRYKDFDENILENAMRPNLNRVVMVMTCSRGLRRYDIDRFAARNRGPEAPGKLVDNNRELKTDLTEPPNLTPTPSHLTPAKVQYIESTLPFEQVITDVRATRLLPKPQVGPPFIAGDMPFVRNQSYAVKGAPPVEQAGERINPPSDENDRRGFEPQTPPTLGRISNEGSGQNYLSNEIFYRTALLRESERPPIPATVPPTLPVVMSEKSPLATGHFHLPFEGNNSNDPFGTAPGLLYSVRTAAERFLKFLYLLRASDGTNVKSDFSFQRTDVNSTSPPVMIRITNTTKQTINVFPGDQSAPFGVQQWPGPVPTPLPAYGSIDIPFVFRPTAPGVQTQAMKFMDGNGELLLKINLTGEGAPVVNIAGRVMAGSSGLSGVTVALTGTRSLNATTDAAGNYSFANLPSGGTYSVKPSKANYTFNPTDRPFTALTTNATADFTASLVPRRIRGRAKTASGTGIPGATVTLSGSQTASTTSDSTGVYTFDNLPAGGNYTVTPTLSGYIFTPASQTFNNLTTDVDFDFPGAPSSYIIAGRVTVGGAALAGVTVALTGSQSATATSDANGDYSFPVMAQGTYMLVPSKAGYSFSPENTVFNHVGGNQTANFAATLNRYRISGSLTNAQGIALSGATVTLSGSQAASTTSNSQGAYTFDNLPAGGNYTVTPTLSGYEFTPTSRAFNALDSDQSGNFTAAATTPGSATVYDVVNDFSPTQNQGPAWSYGYRVAGNNALIPLPNNSNAFGLVAGMHSWNLPNSYNLPAIVHNGTGTTQSYYGATQPTDLLNLFPGAAGESSVVRWMATSAGTAQITGRFQGLDVTTTAVSVVKNGNVTLLSGNVNGLGNQVPFSFTLDVAVNDTIEFRVNSNGDMQHDSTGLAATITVRPPALTFNAVNDFSPTQNQGPAWSYGYRGAGGGAFAPLPNNDNLYGLAAGMHTWYVPNSYNLPAVIHNGTGATQSYFGASQPIDLLNLFPGAAGESSVVRWTAPRAGTAQITGRFQGLDVTTTAVSVVKNGSITLASGSVNGLGNQATFSLSVSVAAGDTVEFRVNSNGDVQHDSTGLAVAITLQ